MCKWIPETYNYSVKESCIEVGYTAYGDPTPCNDRNIQWNLKWMNAPLQILQKELDRFAVSNRIVENHKNSFYFKVPELFFLCILDTYINTTEISTCNTWVCIINSFFVTI